MEDHNLGNSSFRFSMQPFHSSRPFDPIVAPASTTAIVLAVPLPPQPPARRPIIPPQPPQCLQAVAFVKFSRAFASYLLWKYSVR